MVQIGICNGFLTKSLVPRGIGCVNIRPNEVFMARLNDWRWSFRPEALVRFTGAGSARDRLTPRLRKSPKLAHFSSLHGSQFLCLAQSLTLIFATLVCLSAPVFGQTGIDDVHVAPRDIPKDAKDVAIVPDPSASNSALSAHVRPLKVDVDLVLVPVTITDPMNRLVTGLEKDNFQLYEGNAQQQIRTFSSEDAPVSIGVIFDSSGSMASKMDRAKEAVMEFFKTANPQDEFFMITFSDEPEVVSDFTSSVDEIQNKLLYAVPRKRTALLDAIYMGLTKMREAKYPKKALLIISDGGDNHSRYTENEIKALVKEADVMIYAIGIYDRYASAMEERLGPQLLSDITELSGGRAFTIDNPNDLADVATKIGIELRNQYVLGYRPNKVVHDGKWRKIKVKLLPPKGLPPLKVYARTGYYAPAE